MKFCSKSYCRLLTAPDPVLLPGDASELYLSTYSLFNNSWGLLPVSYDPGIEKDCRVPYPTGHRSQS